MRKFRKFKSDLSQKSKTKNHKSQKQNTAKVKNKMPQIENLIKKYNETEKLMPMRLPDLKIVITGTKYGYKLDNGVLVIPIGCLKN